MEQEAFFSGYCRQLDESRMVSVVAEGGTLTEVDCCYVNCPHSDVCTIAQRIQDLCRSDG